MKAVRKYTCLPRQGIRVITDKAAIRKRGCDLEQRPALDPPEQEPDQRRHPGEGEDDELREAISFAIRANDLNIRRRINLPKNFRGRPRSRNDRWFMRNDASAGVQRFGDEKLGGNIAIP